MCGVLFLIYLSISLYLDDTQTLSVLTITQRHVVVSSKCSVCAWVVVGQCMKGGVNDGRVWVGGRLWWEGGGG